MCLIADLGFQRGKPFIAVNRYMIKGPLDG